MVSIPMRVPFRGLTNREAVIFKGARWSEFSPFVEYQDAECATWLKAALSFANDELPPLKRDQIRVNATLPAVLPEQVESVLQRFSGFETVKIKVAEKGQTIAEDLARIQKVANLYPTAKLRLDANGGYSLDQVLELVEQLGDFNIEYLEQPVTSLHEMAELKAQLGGKLKICADELIRKTGDPIAVADANAADLIMLKAQPLGGIDAALKISKQVGLPSVVSSAIETSVGLSMGVYLACAVEELDYDCGLGTLNLLAGDVAQNPLLAENSILRPEPIEVSESLLEKYQAAPERQEFWRNKVARCLELLES
ncbi:MAG: O-succinylbenzoate synthase [Actinobacteria bacterium]|nr:O-succinylbenzoate synthase [Actinomycetota bacterium]